MKLILLLHILLVSTFVYSNNVNVLPVMCTTIVVNGDTPGELLESAGKRKQKNILRGLIASPAIATVYIIGATTSAGILMPVSFVLGGVLFVYQVVETYKSASELRKAGVLLKQASSGS
jgi:hypothetical protein